jgi:hypothetical protein
MLYLEPEQMQALRETARKRRISLAALLRQLVQEHLDAPRHAAPPRQRVFLKIVGLGASGQKDVSARHDAFLVKALYREHAR